MVASVIKQERKLAVTVLQILLWRVPDNGRDERLLVKCHLQLPVNVQELCYLARQLGKKYRLHSVLIVSEHRFATEDIVNEIPQD